ncbi:MAG TPA: glycosyltransferase family 4 protein [Chthoniobacterales bacterium]|nr:glycosyltransferase family 4 protein [Chthoniobacterales bacterium]
MGAIDAVLYPVGGPQLVPLVRDICLLPWMLLTSKKVIFHFHAAGIAETFDHYPFLLRRIVRFLYRKGEAAIVMTEFGKRDAACLGIDNINVVPHTLEDTYECGIVRRNTGARANILYVGHLCQEKGTPALLQAFAALRKSGADCSLELVGECLPPYTEDEMRSSIQRLGLENAVELSDVLSGKEKWNRFARADLFVFPSLAPESFGLVTVEAMMWALPVVACDWRGNREILGEPFGGILFQPTPNLADALVDALREALALRSKWREWGAVNRRTFENNYKARTSRSPLLEVLEQLV